MLNFAALVCITLLADPQAADPLATPTLPVAPTPEHARAPRDGAPELLYINFDGAVLQSGCGNDSRYDCSTLAERFDNYVGPFEGNATQRMAILQSTRNAVADFGVWVTTQRPPDDRDYTMVVYGDLGEQEFAGIAPYIDCGDLHRNDTSFSRGFTSSNTGSAVILQEAAHTWGLEHVDAPSDILNPFKTPGFKQRFVDECFRIVANTDLEPTAGACNPVHTQFCEAGFQNSRAEMMHLFGPPIPDLEPPHLVITYPNDGDLFVFPASFALVGELSDNLHPQFYEMEVDNLGENVWSGNAVELDLSLKQPPPGDYDIVVRVVDEGGNLAEDRVRFTVLPEGSELPEDPSEDALDPSGCRLGGSPPGWGWLLALLALGRRSARTPAMD